MCDFSDKKNSSSTFQVSDSIFGKDVEKLLYDKASVCHKCEIERRSDEQLVNGLSKCTKNPLLVEFSLSKLHLSPAKRKPLIKHSKLKIIGSQIFQELKTDYLKTLPNASCDISIMMKERESSVNEGLYESKNILPSDNSESLFKKETGIEKLLLNSKGKSAFIESKSLFDQRKSNPIMHDFKSLSLKEKVIQSDTSSEACTQFKFSSHGLSHRGHILANQRILRRRSRKLTDSELPNLKTLSISDTTNHELKLTCAEQARNYEDITTDELAAYLDNFLYFPKKMSYMAEMMYT